MGEGTRIETSGPGPGPGPVKYLDLSILAANRGSVANRRSVGGSSTMVALLKDALRAAEEAAGKAAAFRPTTESTLERIRAAEEQAEEHGDSVKQSAQADVLMRKWLRFLLIVGGEYGFKDGDAPSLELVKHFTTYCFVTRDNVSSIGREGMGDSYELQVRVCERVSERCMCEQARARERVDALTAWCVWQIRYMLAKFVFPKLGYPGWVCLGEHELKEKCEPFKYEVREHWKRLKRSNESMESTLKPYVKTKWCDTAYFLAQACLGPPECDERCGEYVACECPCACESLLDDDLMNI